MILYLEFRFLIGVSAKSLSHRFFICKLWEKKICMLFRIFMRNHSHQPIATFYMPFSHVLLTQANAPFLCPMYSKTFKKLPLLHHLRHYFIWVHLDFQFHRSVTALMIYILANTIANRPSSSCITPEQQHLTQFPAPFYETVSHRLLKVSQKSFPPS